MVKRFQEFVKYTKKELESYAKKEGSCIHKVNTNLHVSLPPYNLTDFKPNFLKYIKKNLLGVYNIKVDGFLLDIVNVKVIGANASLRCEDPKMHVRFNADCYLFRPEIGVVLNGSVSHIGKHHVGVVIYRIFNANLKFKDKVEKYGIYMGQEIQITVKNFNLQTSFHIIEGELAGELAERHRIKDENKDLSSQVDSGIEDRESHDLNESIPSVKEEFLSESEKNFNISNELNESIKSMSKRKRKRKESTDVASIKDDNSTVDRDEISDSTRDEAIPKSPKEKKKRKQQTIKIEDSISDSSITTSVAKTKKKKLKRNSKDDGPSSSKKSKTDNMPDITQLNIKAEKYKDSS